jgi:hypothetical protein
MIYLIAHQGTGATKWLENETEFLNRSIGLWRWYSNITITILDNELSWFCDRRSVGLSALVSGTPLGLMARYIFFPFFCRTIAVLFVLGRPLWRENGSVICSAICLIWDYWILFPSPLTIRRDYGGSILTCLHAANSGHYPSSCLLFKTQLNRFVRSSQGIATEITKPKI